MSDVVLLILAGGSRGNSLEQMLGEARAAAAWDMVERALTVSSISRVVVATDSPELQDCLAGLPVTVDMVPQTEDFHFGRRLLGCLERHRIERVIYMGSGSGVLLSPEALDEMARTLAGSDRILVVNNFYSTDFAAWTPAACLSRLPVLGSDNELGQLLGRTCGLPVVALERNAATQFDIDTPVDLLLVRSHQAVGPHLRYYLDGLDLDSSRLDRALPLMTDSHAQVIVSGRIGLETLACLEKYTACRMRVLSEERGLRADGRLHRHEARSLLGFLLERAGLEEGFALLSEMGDAAFIDSRVLWAHFARWPSAGDRFLSDLGRVHEIEDEWLRAFTSAALAAPIPIVLGGHSLVSGGMYALVESLNWEDGE